MNWFKYVINKVKHLMSPNKLTQEYTRLLELGKKPWTIKEQLSLRNWLDNDPLLVSTIRLHGVTKPLVGKQANTPHRPFLYGYEQYLQMRYDNFSFDLINGNYKRTISWGDGLQLIVGVIRCINNLNIKTKEWRSEYHKRVHSLGTNNVQHPRPGEK